MKNLAHHEGTKFTKKKQKMNFLWADNPELFLTIKF